MTLQAVLFDLDGTIVDSERDNVESVVLAMRRLGKEMTALERAFVIGHSWRDIHAMLVKGHGITMSMDDLITLAIEEKNGLIAAKGYRELPGARSLIERLSRRVPLAIASGASHREVVDAVTSLGVEHRFRVLLGAEDYGAGKPDPTPYLTAMQMLSVSPEGCVVIEDATPGILSGKAAGAAVIAVRAGNFAGYDLTPAHVVVDTLDDVTDDLLGRVLTLR
jgi:HAD superfamily hydrolase (TIGR01509 family)